MVVVASGAPGTPLVCWADAEHITKTASAKTGSRQCGSFHDRILHRM